MDRCEPAERDGQRRVSEPMRAAATSEQMISSHTELLLITFVHLIDPFARRRLGQNLVLKIWAEIENVIQKHNI